MKHELCKSFNIKCIHKSVYNINTPKVGFKFWFFTRETTIRKCFKYFSNVQNV